MKKNKRLTYKNFIKIFVCALTMLLFLTACSDEETSNKGKISGDGESNSGNVSDGKSDNEENDDNNQSDSVDNGDKTEGWTIFVYLCGSDLESGQGSATSDLEEMLSDDWGDNVTFVVETGGSNSWYNETVSADKLQRYEIKNGELTLLDEKESASMGDASTLKDFVVWGKEKYNTKNTGFIFWNHGGGSISGVCFDEKYSNDSLSLEEISTAFSSALNGDKYSFVGYDACLMSSLENANMLVPYAEYMISSEETEPGNGWDYSALGQCLSDSEQVDTVELGQGICDGFYESCKETDEEDMVTLSVIDLSKISGINEALNTASKEILEISQDISALGTVSKGINKSENYGGNTPEEGYTNMVDLGNLFENISENVSSSGEVTAAIQEAVAYKVNGDGRANSNGLSIYYPLAIQGSEELSIFTKLCGSENYAAFVNMMVYGAANGDVSQYSFDTENGSSEDLDWSFASESSDDFSTDENSYVKLDSGMALNEDNCYFVTINPDTLDYVQTVQYSLMADWYKDGNYYYLGVDNNIDMDLDTGVVTDNFQGEWPALPDGSLLMYYVVEENDDYTVFSAPIRLNGKDTNLRFLYNYQAEMYEVIGTWDGIDETCGISAKNIYKLKTGDIIEPYYVIYNAESGEESEQYGDKYTVEDSFEIEDFVLPDGDYYYQFEITDVFGLTTYSDFAKFYVDEEGEVYID